MTETGILNKEFIASTLTVDDPWCSGHGALKDSPELGAGMLYYGLAYSLRARVCMCLGSGGGFVPKVMRQAQRDLGLADARTILVDGASDVSIERKEIWGSPYWISDSQTFRQNYPEIEIELGLTEKLFHERFKADGLTVDFLHIDADHHYDGVKRDWELYRQLVTPDGVITLHDTVNYRKPCGVPQLIEEIRKDPQYELVNFPLAYGTAIVKRILNQDENTAAAKSSLRTVTGRR